MENKDSIFFWGVWVWTPMGPLNPPGGRAPSSTNTRHPSTSSHSALRVQQYTALSEGRTNA
jgi:hypothetical protein